MPIQKLNEKVISRLKDLCLLKMDEPLKNYTSFKTGGPADLLVWPNDYDSLKEILQIASANTIPVIVLGGCTNLLVCDNGIKGIVLMLNEKGNTDASIAMNKNGYIYSDSMITKEGFVNFCINNEYEGMEFMAGIPGCIGGGIVMNAGTADGNFADILYHIEYINREGEKHIKNVTGDMAGYRTMEFPVGSVILGASFKLKKAANINDVRKKINEIKYERNNKHPLNYPSAGSVFKNPAGFSSWKLIDDAGLKGKKIGGAVVSDLHTNFIINIDNATSKDIQNLVQHIQEVVYTKFNVTLETEIEMVGY